VGQVSFDIKAVDSQSNSFLSDVQIQVTYGGTVQGGAIGAGEYSVNFVVPNNTQMNIKAKKTGYNDASASVNSGPSISNETVIHMVPNSVRPTPTSSKTGVIPTRTVITGNATPVATTPPPSYTGFWGPLANWFGAMGADPTTIGLLLAALFIFCGFVVGGFGGASFGTPGFNAGVAVIGGVFGFLLSVAFGFIPLVYLFGIVFLVAFYFILMR
jgi:hypothetical protein